VFPVTDAAAKRRLRDEILEAYLRDDVKARLLEPDGSYVRAPQSTPASGKKKPICLSAQDWFMQISADPEMRLGAQLPPATVPKDIVKIEAEAMVTGAE
jgi:polyphosphate kinase